MPTSRNQVARPMDNCGCMPCATIRSIVRTTKGALAASITRPFTPMRIRQKG